MLWSSVNPTDGNYQNVKRPMPVRPVNLQSAIMQNTQFVGNETASLLGAHTSSPEMSALKPMPASTSCDPGVRRMQLKAMAQQWHEKSQKSQTRHQQEEMMKQSSIGIMGAAPDSPIFSIIRPPPVIRQLSVPNSQWPMEGVSSEWQSSGSISARPAKRPLIIRKIPESALGGVRGEARAKRGGAVASPNVRVKVYEESDDAHKNVPVATQSVATESVSASTSSVTAADIHAMDRSPNFEKPLSLQEILAQKAASRQTDSKHHPSVPSFMMTSWRSPHTSPPATYECVHPFASLNKRPFTSISGHTAAADIIQTDAIQNETCQDDTASSMTPLFTSSSVTPIATSAITPSSFATSSIVTFANNPSIITPLIPVSTLTPSTPSSTTTPPFITPSLVAPPPFITPSLVAPPPFITPSSSIPVITQLATSDNVEVSVQDEPPSCVHDTETEIINPTEMFQDVEMSVKRPRIEVEIINDEPPAIMSSFCNRVEDVILVAETAPECRTLEEGYVSASVVGGPSDLPVVDKEERNRSYIPVKDEVHMSSNHNLAHDHNITNNHILGDGQVHQSVPFEGIVSQLEFQASRLKQELQKDKKQQVEKDKKKELDNDKNEEPQKDRKQGGDNRIDVDRYMQEFQQMYPDMGLDNLATFLDDKTQEFMRNYPILRSKCDRIIEAKRRETDTSYDV